MPTRRLRLTWTCIAALGAVVPREASAQWVTSYEQHYLPGDFNWQFRTWYPIADRLFNAFDFGHAILYETLWKEFDRSVPRLEQYWYDRLTRDILLNPPRVPLEESAIEVHYARLAPEAKMMFDWAHLFHRQIYDVWADERLAPNERDAKIAELTRYYKSRRDLAFSSKPKSMVLMQEQPYSLAFRKRYPKFNGLIWAYHWLQVGLYEPLVTGRSVDEKQAGIRAAVARFWQMLQNPPQSMPYVMPMTAAVAPEFARRYPEAAIIFDNLHSMHDVVSDILANPDVPRARKRAEIMLAAQRYRDDTSFVMTEDAWRTMARHMGLENMGGPAVGFQTALPTPTVTYGAVMTHDDRTGEMTGFAYGNAVGGDHAQHGAAPARDSSGARAAGHEGHDMPPTDSVAAHREWMLQLFTRMMADTTVRRRVLADTALRRMMMEMVDQLPAEHRDHMREMLRVPPDANARRPESGLSLFGAALEPLGFEVHVMPREPAVQQPDQRRQRTTPLQR
jgi:hypothetical protein